MRLRWSKQHTPLGIVMDQPPFALGALHEYPRRLAFSPQTGFAASGAHSFAFREIWSDACRALLRMRAYMSRLVNALSAAARLVPICEVFALRR
jgi:hypothetical protein